MSVVSVAGFVNVSECREQCRWCGWGLRQMPCWQLPLEETGGASPASPHPLYLGSIPSNPAETYAALLATRPQALGTGAYAVLGQGLGTTEPHFTLIVNGEPAVTLGTYNSLFHILFMFVKVPPILHIFSTLPASGTKRSVIGLLEAGSSYLYADVLGMSMSCYMPMSC